MFGSVSSILRSRELQGMTMAYTLMLRGCILLYLHIFVINCQPYEHEDIVDVKVLNVGEELKQETLPLQMGHRRYQLHGLKASMWYEVKISYPASDKSYIGLNMKRRLLNTEKLIFKADYNLLSEHSEVHVLLTVEPGGVVAKPHVQERRYVIFNIVCDELSLVSPPKVWWVVILAFLCLGVALTIPYFLPPLLLPKNHSSRFGDLASSKAS